MWWASQSFSIPFVSGLVYNSLISTKGYKMPNCDLESDWCEWCSVESICCIEGLCDVCKGDE